MLQMKKKDVRDFHWFFEMTFTKPTWCYHCDGKEEGEGEERREGREEGEEGGEEGEERRERTERREM
jgi:hypothetical protein